MRPGIVTLIGTVAVTLIAVCVSQSQSSQSSSTVKAETSSKPLLLEKNEGEERIWRDPPPGGFMLKVSPKNNGSEHLVFGTEVLSPGETIPRHKHLRQDEILLIQTGTAHIQLGKRERDLHAGGLVFIPANTWVSLKNAGTEPINLAFIFSAPGFEDYMRCVSVPANEKPTPTTAEEERQCEHEGHVVYRDMKEGQEIKK